MICHRPSHSKPLGAAVGLAVAVLLGTASAQESRPTEQSQPDIEESQAERDLRAADSDDRAGEGQREASQPLPPLNVIIDSPVDTTTADQEPTERNPDPQQEANEIARRDLAAQQSMSYWTVWIAAAACIQLFLSFVGIALIWLNLREARRAADAGFQMLDETRKTTEISHKQLVASQRPWLKTTMKMQTGLFFENGAMKMSIRFTVKNVGNYPARNIWLDATVNVNQFGTREGVEAYLNRAIQNSLIKRPIQMGKFLLPGEDYSIIHSFKIDEETMKDATSQTDFVFPKIVGCVRYDFDTSPSGHYSAFVRELFRCDGARQITVEKNRAPDVIFPDEGNIKSGSLEIRDGFQSGDYAN